MFLLGYLRHLYILVGSWGQGGKVAVVLAGAQPAEWQAAELVITTAS